MAARADLHTAYQDARDRRRRATSASRSGRSSPNSTRSCAGSACAAGSPRSTPTRRAQQRSTRRRQDAPNLPRRPGRAAHRRAGLRGRQVPALDVPHAHLRQLRPGGRRRRRARPRHATTTAAPPGTRSTSRRCVDRFWQNTAPLRRLGGPVLRHHRTATPRRPALPRRPPRHHPPRRAARHRRRHLPPGVVAAPRRDQLHRASGAAVGRRRARVRRPRHRRAAAHLRRRRRRARPSRRTSSPFGPQVHVKGILGGTEEAGRHIGYLTKYLTKSRRQAAGLADDLTERQREHRRRLVAELERTPCSPQLPDLAALRHPAPQGPPHRPMPGVCKGKAHQARTPRHRRPPRPRLPEVVEQDPRRPPRRADRVRSATARSRPTCGPATPSTTAPSPGRRPDPATPTSPPDPALLLHAISQRQRWKADYLAAQLAAGEPPGIRSATEGTAA